jgi:hypothetical protein
VPAGTRPSLRPLGSRGRSDEAKLGRNQPREGEGVSVRNVEAFHRHPEVPERSGGLEGWTARLHRGRSSFEARCAVPMHCATRTSVERARATPRSRAPDAAQRSFSAALQSRGPCRRSVPCRFWVPALRSNACALQLVRDTRVSGDDAPCSVIASAAKKSRVFPRRDSGLLRCARNDDLERACANTSLSCPGRSAAPLRCAAEPGPIYPSNPCGVGPGSAQQR